MHHKLTEGGDYVYAYDNRVHRHSRSEGKPDIDRRCRLGYRISFVLAEHPGRTGTLRYCWRNALTGSTWLARRRYKTREQGGNDQVIANVDTSAGPFPLPGDSRYDRRRSVRRGL